MTIREALIAVLGATVLFAAMLGGALVLLQADFFTFQTQPSELDCTDPNTNLCRLRNFFNARSQEDGTKGACLRSGLPANCTDL